MKVSEFNNLSNKGLADYLRSESINTLPAEKDDPKACFLKWKNGEIDYQNNRIPDKDFEEFDLATIDVAFISATKILPAVVPLLREQGKIITLIKPQFEVGKGEVGKGGIVKDPAKHQRVVGEVNSVAELLGLTVSGVIESPIQGADGNVEFLALYRVS